MAIESFKEEACALLAIWPAHELLLHLEEQRGVELEKLGQQVEEHLELRLGGKLLCEQLIQHEAEEARKARDQLLLGHCTCLHPFVHAGSKPKQIKRIRRLLQQKVQDAVQQAIIVRLSGNGLF